MNSEVQNRVVLLANYIIKTNDTVRGAAAKFGVSKSTVHTDLTKRLTQIDKTQHNKVRKILDENKSQRHIRGGLATKQKYENKKQENFK